MRNGTRKRSRSGRPSRVAASAPVPPGTVLAVHGDGVDVACGEGALRLHSVQPAGGKRMAARAFAAGRAIAPGGRFAVRPDDAR